MPKTGYRVPWKVDKRLSAWAMARFCLLSGRTHVHIVWRCFYIGSDRVYEFGDGSLDRTKGTIVCGLLLIEYVCQCLGLLASDLFFFI